MADTPKFNDSTQVLLFKLAKSTEALIPNPQVAYFNDDIHTLVYKAAKNLSTYTGT